MESEIGWMRYYSCNIGCLINSEKNKKMKGAARGWRWLLARPVEFFFFDMGWLDKNKREASYNKKKQTGRHFPLRFHGWGTSSLSSAEAALPATVLKSEGMGRVRGFHFW